MALLPPGYNPRTASQRLASSLANMAGAKTAIGNARGGVPDPYDAIRGFQMPADPYGSISNMPDPKDPYGSITGAYSGTPGAAPAATGGRDWNAYNPDDWVNGVNRYNPNLGGQDPNSPPGPVGEGPGFWKWDAWGKHWRSDWVNVGGRWMISGEN